MKNLLITSVFTLIFLSASVDSAAQMVVNDPTLTTATIENWRSSLDNATKQYKEIKEQSDILKEGIEKYRKVNNTIKNGKKVKDLIERQVQIINILSVELSNAGKNRDIIDLDAHESYVRRLNSLLSTSKDNVVTLTDILTDSRLNLSDYERLKLLDDLDKNSTNVLTTLHFEKREYNELNSKLEGFQKLLSK